MEENEFIRNGTSFTILKAFPRESEAEEMKEKYSIDLGVSGIIVPIDGGKGYFYCVNTNQYRLLKHKIKAIYPYKPKMKMIFDKDEQKYKAVEKYDGIDINEN
jgi:hypothetical protein